MCVCRWVREEETGEENVGRGRGNEEGEKGNKPRRCEKSNFCSLSPEVIFRSRLIEV